MKAETAIVARLLCGCVVAMEFEDEETERANYARRGDYVRKGYMVSVVPATEAMKLWTGAKYPCDHMRASIKKEYK